MSRFANIPELGDGSRRLLGGVLLALALLLLGLTERAERARKLGEDALGGAVLTGSRAVPGYFSNGRLLLVSGAPEVTAPAIDRQFGISLMAPALKRKVEMLQWQQTGYGGQPGYDLDWFDRVVDSSRFAVPRGHANPRRLPLASARFDAPDVTLAGFKLDSELVRMIPGAEPWAPDFRALPANMRATFHAEGEALVSGAAGQRPRVGDLKISWSRVDPPLLTVLARNQAGTLVPARGPNGAVTSQVMLGRMSLAEVMPGLPVAPSFAWARRVLALLLGWGGVALLLPSGRRHDRLLAVAAAAVPLAAVAVACWFDARVLLAGGLLVVMVLAASVAVRRWRS